MAAVWAVRTVASDFRFRVSGFGLRVSCSRFRATGFGFRVAYHGRSVGGDNSLGERS